ncbi:MAG: hypothetical protein HQ557_12695 [Bacteroidetes bacterium]|nr:hypothetical protein [Bacteroidota bacterium]
MAKAYINAGICGFTTGVDAVQNDEGKVEIAIDSTCPHIMKAAESIKEVEPFNEIGFYSGSTPSILQAHYSCPHAACPVFSGVVKAVEVAAGLALPKDVSITVTK